MILDADYFELLNTRLEYFKEKKITDLEDEEIQEFINLKKEVAEQFSEVSKVVKGIWDEIYGDSFKKYQERVLNK